MNNFSNIHCFYAGHSLFVSHAIHITPLTIDTHPLHTLLLASCNTNTLTVTNSLLYSNHERYSGTWLGITTKYLKCILQHHHIPSIHWWMWAILYIFLQPCTNISIDGRNNLDLKWGMAVIVMVMRCTKGVASKEEVVVETFPNISANDNKEPIMHNVSSFWLV